MFSHLFRVVFRKSRNNVTCKIVDCSIERLVAVFTSADKRNWLFLLWVLHRRQCRLLLLLGFNFYVSTSLSSPSGARWELSSYHTHYSLKTKLTGHLIISQSRILLFSSSCKFQHQKIFNVQILQAAGFRENMVNGRAIHWTRFSAAELNDKWGLSVYSEKLPLFSCKRSTVVFEERRRTWKHNWEEGRSFVAWFYFSNFSKTLTDAQNWQTKSF